MPYKITAATLAMESGIEMRKQAGPIVTQKW
jgi:hypothetical protein